MFPYGDGHFREGLSICAEAVVQPSCATKSIPPTTVVAVAAEEPCGSEERPHGLAAPHGGPEAGQRG